MEIAGLKVVDARKPLTITINSVDVKKGANKDPAACAAARSLVRNGHCTEARVHLGRTYIKTKNERGSQVWVRYMTPESIRTEIVSFDRGAQFDEGEYTLRPPSRSMRLNRGHAVGSDTNRTKPKHKQIARIKHHQVSGVRHHGAVR